uniref:RING-type E3 ubiquitin transferase n=1 Tax=Anthurium amnicola TaxID=1678845 RepID=A0A1D1Z5G7_9ARAE
MGGCCCCSSRRTELNRTPVYLYCPQTSEEREPLSSAHGPTSAISPALLVHTNLETSSPDTYRAPPAPLPYDMGLVGSQTLSRSFETAGNKADPKVLSESQPLGETVSGVDFEGCEDPKESDSMNRHDFGKGCPTSEDKLSKLSVYNTSPTEEEDVCPTCLEEYDTENPRIITKCEHHFHLSCILEWMERSDTCPICDQIMVIDHNLSDQL